MVQVLIKRVPSDLIVASKRLITSYYLRYNFPDRVPPTGARSTTKAIYSSFESVSRLVDVTQSSAAIEMTWQSKLFIFYFFLEMTVVHYSSLIVDPHCSSIFSGNPH